jgi:hypothetical protein
MPKLHKPAERVLILLVNVRKLRMPAHSQVLMEALTLIPPAQAPSVTRFLAHQNSQAETVLKKKAQARVLEHEIANSCGVCWALQLS